MMDSVYNFMNIGIMISPTPMRQAVKSQHEPEKDLYTEDEWEYQVAVHGMVGGAEEETRRVREWQELFGKYKASSFPLPPDRVYHLQCDTPDLPEKKLDLKSSGLADKDSSVALVINQFCHMGLSHQAVAQASPEDNLQAESHQVYDLLRTKHREAVKSVQTHLNSKAHWVKLMKESTMDDAAESAVFIHADNLPGQVSTVKAKIKKITAGIWDMLKRLTERLAPSVVRTPATVATKAAQEPEIDPQEFEDSVPENTLITIAHSRRFDWITFARDLLIEVLKVPKEHKPAINHKAPSLFVWHENQAWDSVSRISHHFEIPAPDPWECAEYLNLAEAGHRSMEKNSTKEPAALNHWIYSWAYIKVPEQNEDQTPTAYSLGAYLTIIWMSGLLKASEKTKTSIDRMFSDVDRSDLFRFIAKCSDIIDSQSTKGSFSLWACSSSVCCE